MIIDINQQKIAIADKYRIYLNGELHYRASRRLFRFFAIIDLFANANIIPQLTIRKKLAFFYASYDIELSNGLTYHFSTKSFWKRQYQCLVGNDLYKIYGHSARKYSVFRNNIQIAWWDKEPVSWFAGDNYQITADDNISYELLIAFCLIIDHYKSDNHDNNIFNIDLGNVGLTSRKFDAAWAAR